MRSGSIPYSIAGLVNSGLGASLCLIPGKDQRKRPETSGGGLIVLVVNGDGLKILSFKHLIAIEAPDIIHPVASRQNLGTAMLADLHKK